MKSSRTETIGAAKVLTGMMVSALCSVAGATTIDFERLTNSVPNPGDIYADMGVNFSIGTLNGTVAVGSTLTFNTNSNTIWGYGQYGNAWSGAHGGLAMSTDDLMMTFDNAWNQVSLLTDRTIENPELVRLIALRDLTGGNFEVLGYMESMDDGLTMPDCSMSVSSNTAFTHVVFQSTTEQEGIDDLQFGPVPEPTSLTTLYLGVLALVRRRKP